MTPKIPDGYRHHYAMAIRFNDLDGLGHVNNAVYLTYMESARIAYLRELGLWSGGDETIGPIMARAAIDYRAPLVLRDETAHIFSRCSRLGTKSFDMEHLILRPSDGAVAAQGVIVGVAYDYAAGQSIVIPEAWRAVLMAYEPALGGAG